VTTNSNITGISNTSQDAFSLYAKTALLQDQFWYLLNTHSAVCESQKGECVAYIEFVTLIHCTQQLVCNPLLLNQTQERSGANPVIQRIFDILTDKKSGTIWLLLKSYTKHCYILLSSQLTCKLLDNNKRRKKLITHVTSWCNYALFLPQWCQWWWPIAKWQNWLSIWIY